MARTSIATRRDFLNRGLGVVGVSSALPNFLVRSALGAPEAPTGGRIAVALLLEGGHDGLSDVPPYGQEEYGKFRQATRIQDNEVLKLNEEVGLHPNLAGFKELYDQGQCAVVLGTGYPSFNYSHFEARAIWSAADRGWREAGGWLGRYCDHAFKGKGDPIVSVSVGGGRAPLVLKGQSYPGVSFNAPQSFQFTAERGEAEYALYQKLNQIGQGAGNADLQFVTQTAVTANAASEKVREVASKYKPSVTYPNTRLANSFKLIAGMIAGGLSTRVYYTQQGGYDTHGNQRGRHNTLMAQLNDAVTAFQKDLAAQGNADRVMTFTFSEFGRRVDENKSQGTDHGSAQPMFLFGPGVKGGLHGKQPSLADVPRNNLKMSVDFRSVYAAVLEKWLGVPSEPILGEKYPFLDCVG
ncbi:MAG TPA: DUF1501 domain-containing protein [Pirellulaceae bacterium]|nr:DUF1501 domain-containing protein [Pirellulaceae bacterium]